ncbi:hypothetical protein CCP4SC76_5090005 [Gammaproteobacteria bacterium]
MADDEHNDDMEERRKILRRQDDDIHRIINDRLESHVSDAFPEGDKHLHREWHEKQGKSEMEKAERNKRLAENTLGWGLIAALSTLGVAAWEYIKNHVR